MEIFLFQKYCPTPLNLIFFAQYGSLRVPYQTIRNLIEILKNKTSLWDKMPMTKNVIFHQKIAKLKSYAFLSTTLFTVIFYKSMSVFRNIHKITDFFIPMKTYIDKFGPYKCFLKTKISISMWNLKIKKSAFSTFVLDFDLNPIIYSAVPDYEKVNFDPPYCGASRFWLLRLLFSTVGSGYEGDSDLKKMCKPKIILAHSFAY